MADDNACKASGLSGECEALAEKLAAISHPYRIKILHELSNQGGACCGEVVQSLPIAQSTVSQHLKILAQAGLIVVHTEGQKSLYSVNSEALAGVIEEVQKLKCCC